MVKTNTTILREGRQFEVDAGTVTTGTLTDSDDSSAWETLREAGYESGDFIPLINGTNQGTDSTSSSSYTNALGDHLLRFQWDKIIPSNAQGQVALHGRVNPNGDQIDVRLQNLTDSETALEVTGTTGSSFEGFFAGPTDYTPTSPSNANVLFLPQIRNSDGSTSVDYDDAGVIIGFKL